MSGASPLGLRVPQEELPPPVVLIMQPPPELLALGAIPPPTRGNRLHCQSQGAVVS